MFWHIFESTIFANMSEILDFQSTATAWSYHALKFRRHTEDEHSVGDPLSSFYS